MSYLYDIVINVL